MNEATKPVWLNGFKEDYKAIFDKEWSAFTGVVLLVVVMAALMGSGLFWGVFGGIKLWGDYLNNAIGLGTTLGITPQLENILMHRISLMNITLVIGAFSAALLSRQFRLNYPPLIEYFWAIVGGTLMGIGAVFSGGCTVGGFFVPLTLSSSSGWAMWPGLLLGSFIGLKILLWCLENISWGMSAPAVKPARFKKWHPLIGMLVSILVISWAIVWWDSGNDKKEVRALLVIAGFAIGFISHRSRLCFSRAIRQPFMTAEGEMTKAMIFAIALGASIGAIFISNKAIDPYIVIPARFWLGSFIGGLIFGLGMIFAGSCASGSLWRIGEGHLKLMIAVLFFAWSGSTTNALLSKSGLLTTSIDLDFIDGIAEITPLGVQAFMPDMIGNWNSSLFLTYTILFIWYLLVRYNESTNRFTIF